MCGYRWCWSCGMSLDNKFHNAFTPFCQVTSSIMNIKRGGGCLNIICLYLLYINFPVLFLIFMICGTFAATHGFYSNFIRHYSCGDSKYTRCCGSRKKIRLQRMCCRFFATLMITPILFLFLLTLAILFYVFFVLIGWAIFTVFIFVMLFNWIPEGLLSKIFFCRCKFKKPKPLKKD